MDYKNSVIQLAGAGAGKTFEMADNIINYLSEVGSDDKDIIATSYTNFSIQNIFDKFKNEFNGVPETVKILTIHKFLLDYIIYPYSKFILNVKYNSASIIPLSTNIKYKNLRISQLKSQGIIHSEKVFAVAKQIICKSKNDTKKISKSKGIIIEHVKASFKAVFIDECQDVNDDMIQIIKSLNEYGIYIYLVGDTKQALRTPGVLNNFYLEVKNNIVPNFKCNEINNITRRLPQLHVKLSNTICNIEQQQASINEQQGIINFVFSDDADFSTIINEYQSNGICYIKEKTKIFSTCKKSDMDDNILKKLIINLINNEDEDAFLYEKKIELYNMIKKVNSIPSGINQFLNKYKIKIDKFEYAKLSSSIKNVKDSNANYVHSIDKIKGIENKNCMFIMDSSLLEYLFRIKMDENKERNYLYVGLTRSTNVLLLVVDVSTLKKYTKNYISEEMNKLNIRYIDINNGGKNWIV